MQICEMSLEQIRHHPNEASRGEFYIMLAQQEERLEQEINRLTSNLNRLKSLPPKGEAALEYMPQQRIDLH